MRTGQATKGAALKLIPVTVPELLRQLRGPSFPSPAATSRTAMPGHCGAAVTSTALSKPISDGTVLTLQTSHSGELQSSLSMNRGFPGRQLSDVIREACEGFHIPDHGGIDGHAQGILDLPA
jgi:hypothetical protein